MQTFDNRKPPRDSFGSFGGAFYLSKQPSVGKDFKKQPTVDSVALRVVDFAVMLCYNRLTAEARTVQTEKGEVL